MQATSTAVGCWLAEKKVYFDELFDNREGKI